MTKRTIISLFAIVLTFVGISAQNRAQQIIRDINNPKSKTVLVAAHRGDWRNYPENSLKAIESVINMGVDIVEIDLALTADSVLVVCHDRTIDRTTTGKGVIANLTADSISRVFLRAGHGVATTHRMPTFEEVLRLCKDRIVINIDKGYQYYDLAIKVSDSLGATDQLLIKGKSSVKGVEKKLSSHKTRMMYMPIIDILKPSGKKLFDEYLATATVPIAYEVCWDRMTPEVEACMKSILQQGSRLWVNSLWPSLNGGLCDDAAFEGNPDDYYGKLIEMGASIIQTDRPQLLIDYLKSKGLHN